MIPEQTKMLTLAILVAVVAGVFAGGESDGH